MADTQSQGAGAPGAEQVTEKEKPGLLDTIISEGRFSERKLGRDLLEEFVNEATKGHLNIARDAEYAIGKRIGEIDKLISEQLNEILHNPDLQRLEGSWRGLKHLVDHSETGSTLKIRVMNVSKKDLLKDFRGADWDQTALFKKIYEEEYGVFGGAPFGALIGDYEFGRHPEDLELLEQISHVAAAAHAPFISAASPDMMNLKSFTQLDAPRDLAKVFDSVAFAKWKSFRDSEDSRYTALTLPRTLGRLPYGPDTRPVEAFGYVEDVDGKDHSKYLWMNAAYSMGTRLTDSFAKYGMCVAMRGVEGGGLVEGLPVHNFTTDDGDLVMKCPTEAPITDRREKELSELGFLPLLHCKDTDYAAFFGAQTCQKPKKFDQESANANARLSTQLPYIMAVSRFAHYLKVMCRDKIGSFMSREQTENFLNTWIKLYVTPDDSASATAKAKRPLRDARVEVVEVPGRPGSYRAVAYLRPHFQLEELTVSLRLVADLPQAAK